MKKEIKLSIIQNISWLDEEFNHPFKWLCRLIANHSWWGDGYKAYKESSNAQDYV
ncbi:MAG TPA: hypothetical protein VII94_04650 [Candidatus Saccharimonadales bacterium]